MNVEDANNKWLSKIEFYKNSLKLEKNKNRKIRTIQIYLIHELKDLISKYEDVIEKKKEKYHEIAKYSNINQMLLEANIDQYKFYVDLLINSLCLIVKNIFDYNYSEEDLYTTNGNLKVSRKLTKNSILSLFLSQSTDNRLNLISKLILKTISGDISLDKAKLLIPSPPSSSSLDIKSDFLWREGNGVALYTIKNNRKNTTIFYKDVNDVELTNAKIMNNICDEKPTITIVMKKIKIFLPEYKQKSVKETLKKVAKESTTLMKNKVLANKTEPQIVDRFSFAIINYSERNEPTELCEFKAGRAIFLGEIKSTIDNEPPFIRAFFHRGKKMEAIANIQLGGLLENCERILNFLNYKSELIAQLKIEIRHTGLNNSTYNKMPIMRMSLPESVLNDFIRSSLIEKRNSYYYYTNNLNHNNSFNESRTYAMNELHDLIVKIDSLNSGLEN